MDTEKEPTLSQTPAGNRVRISFFGLRNAGKSTLVNDFCGQDVAIVSDVPGTTTDPVSKAMEILPLGPCMITDTAGLDDDAGALGAQRVRRTLDVLAVTDIAVWVSSPEMSGGEIRARFDEECRRYGVAVLEFTRGDSTDDLKQRIAGVKIDQDPGLLDGLVEAGDRVVCVCPIDESAPKGRLILPQVQVIRECLDRRASCVVCQPGELERSIPAFAASDKRPILVITDSQAFSEVERILKPRRDSVRLTSFSILFARQKGDLALFAKGLKSLSSLKNGDVVLVAEGCTHHRQCNDIGTVKIPAALKRLTGKDLSFVFSSGKSFPSGQNVRPSLIVHCGGCMLSRREMMRRLALASEGGVPVVNYGLLLAAACGVKIEI